MTFSQQYLIFDGRLNAFFSLLFGSILRLAHISGKSLFLLFALLAAHIALPLLLNAAGAYRQCVCQHATDRHYNIGVALFAAVTFAVGCGEYAWIKRNNQWFALEEVRNIESREFAVSAVFVPLRAAAMAIYFFWLLLGIEAVFQLADADAAADAQLLLSQCSPLERTQVCYVTVSLVVLQLVAAVVVLCRAAPCCFHVLADVVRVDVRTLRDPVQLAAEPERYDASVLQDNLRCPVCLDEFDNDRGQLLQRLPCNHFFHSSCVREWLKRSELCPLCKQSVQETP